MQRVSSGSSQAETHLWALCKQRCLAFFQHYNIQDFFGVLKVSNRLQIQRSTVFFLWRCNSRPTPLNHSIPCFVLRCLPWLIPEGPLFWAFRISTVTQQHLSFLQPWLWAREPCSHEQCCDHYLATISDFPFLLLPWHSKTMFLGTWQTQLTLSLLLTCFQLLNLSVASCTFPYYVWFAQTWEGLRVSRVSTSTQSSLSSLRAARSSPLVW